MVTRLTNITKSDKFSSIKDLMIQKDGKLFAAENVFGTAAVEVITWRTKISWVTFNLETTGLYNGRETIYFVYGELEKNRT